MDNNEKTKNNLMLERVLYVLKILFHVSIDFRYYSLERLKTDRETETSICEKIDMKWLTQPAYTSYKRVSTLTTQENYKENNFA